MEDIKALPEGQRAELVDGRLYMMAPPKVSHDRIVFRMGTVLDQHILDKGTGQLQRLCHAKGCQSCSHKKI